MSLIFKALQNFQQPRFEAGDKLEELQPKRNGHSFKKILFSPPVALGAAVAIFVVGALVSQAINHIPRKDQPRTAIAEASLSDEQAAQSTAPVPNRGRGGSPAPEPVSHQTSGPNHEVIYQVHAPNRVQDDPAKPISEGAVQMPLNHADSPVEGRSTPAAQFAVASLEFHYTAPTGQVDTKDRPVNQQPAPLREVQAAVLGQQAAVSPNVGSGAFTQSRSVKPLFGSGAAMINEAPAEPENHLTPIRNQEHQAARAKRHLQVARLVNKIHIAIQADDIQMTSKLLKTLVEFKGPEHPFVSKLRAYSLIRQERLEEAKRLLARVLAQSGNDLEAGLNMAVINIKTGHYDDARRRLVKLQALYPEQEKISFYLKQLPR